MTSENHRQSRWIILVLLVPALLGVCFVVLSTRWGAGTSPDSAGYISIARSLASGDGYRGLHGGYATVWPPLYTYVLTAAGSLGPNLLVASRWINAALFGATIFLVGLILRRYVRLGWVAVLGAVLTAASIDLIRIHSMVWSEPLFTCLALLGLWLLVLFLERPNWGLLVLCAAAAAMAAFARYAGVSLIATGGFMILFTTRQRLTRRLANTALYGLIACLPLAGWFLRNALVTGDATGRQILFHPVQPRHAGHALSTISLWLMPEWMPPAVRIGSVIAAALVITVLAVVLARRRPAAQQKSARPAWPRLVVTSAVFVAAYLLQHAATITFFDRFADIRFRQMAPLFPVLTIIAVCVLDQALVSLRRAPRIALTVLVLLAALWQVNRAAWRVNWYSIDGLGLANAHWRTSALVDHVKQLDPAVPVFTNCADIVYFLANRIPEGIPERYDYRSGVTNPHFADDLDALRARLENDGGVIVYFENVPGHRYLASRAELEQAMPLRTRADTPDGVIYELDR